MIRRPRLVLFAVIATSFAAGNLQAADPFGLAGTGPGDLADGDAGVPVQGAAYCQTCHGQDPTVPNDPGADWLPYDTWAGTMMANAARDPLFLAALTVANQDKPGIGTFCLRCHTNAGFVRGNATIPDGSQLDDNDMQGVGCEVCHRASDDKNVDPQAPYIGNAQLLWATNNVKRGPYSDSQSPVHASLQSDYTTGSALCGGCHEVSNPVVNMVNEAGADLGTGFPLDTTYTEWLNSGYSAAGSTNKSCQDCHMRRHTEDQFVCRLSGQPTRPKPRTHAFAAANVWGIDAVKAADPAYAALHVQAFALARAEAEAVLKTAASVEITSLPTTAEVGSTISVGVKVTNQTGHKFPTGYADGRRAFVSIAWADATDAGSPQETVVLGAYDASNGTIQADPPTRIYHAVHAERAANGTLTFDHLARHNFIVEDTRIPPLGFVSTPATLPKGPINYSDGAGGFKSSDEASFTIPVPEGPTGFRKLVVRVNYQTVTQSYIDFLASENSTDDRGTKLAQIYTDTGKAAPIVVAQTEALVSVEGGALPDAGVPDASVGDASTEEDSGTKPKPKAASDDDGGCGCRTPSHRDVQGIAQIDFRWLILGSAFALFVARRGRRRH
jgi:hypothetical protein